MPCGVSRTRISSFLWIHRVEIDGTKGMWHRSGWTGRVPSQSSKRVGVFWSGGHGRMAPRRCVSRSSSVSSSCCYCCSCCSFSKDTAASRRNLMRTYVRMPLKPPRSLGNEGRLQLKSPWEGMTNPTINLVVKFGGSSLASAERMVEVAQIICGFNETLPIVVLSAMGKTTNLLLQSGSEALHSSPKSVSTLKPLR